VSEDVKAPTIARGYTTQPTEAVTWWTELAAEHVPALRWPLSIPVYEEMQTDPAVGPVVMSVAHPLREAAWRIDPAGARDEVVNLVAGDLNLPVIGRPEVVPIRMGGRFSWRDHFRESLDSLWLGAAFFEQEGEYRREDGLVHLNDLVYLPLETFVEPPKVNRKGGLISVKQSGLAGESAVTIPVDHLVAYVRDRRGGNWFGKSVLRPAYQPWLLRDRNVRLDTVKNDRYGAGVPWHEAATQDQSEVDAGLAIAKQFRSGAESGLSTRNGAKWSIVTPNGQAPDTLGTVKYHDSMIAKTVLGHWMNLGQQSGTGSYALGRVQVEQFTNGLQTILDDHRDIAQAHIVEDLVDWNWGRDEPAPKLVVDRLAESWTAMALKALVEAGILFPDRQTEEWVRQSIGAPPKTPQETAA
jgi:hypothetical protein